MDAAAEQSLRRMLELRGARRPVARRGARGGRRARGEPAPASFALGTTYVRVPVSRTLTLTNLTRIATTFDCVHHVRQGRASVEIDPPSGVLQPAEVLKLVVTVTAEVDGPLDLLVGAVLHGGTAKPVGCSIGATVQGLTVSYEAVAQNDPKLDDLPKALPPPADVVDANGVAIARPPPDVPPTPTIDFGRDVPIFEQRSVVLLVTNLSAVRALQPHAEAATRRRRCPWSCRSRRCPRTTPRRRRRSRTSSRPTSRYARRPRPRRAARASRAAPRGRSSRRRRRPTRSAA